MKTEILIAFFIEQGFIQVPNDSFKQLTLAPDFIFEKGTILKAIVVRESADTLPQTLILRYSESKRIPTKNLELYFFFSQKPGLAILKNCKSLSIGILYCSANDRIELFAESKIIKGRRKITSIPNTKIFFSSRQNLQERIDGKEIIETQREALHVPLFAMLVEDDQHYSSNINQLWPIIERCMDDCTYVLIILSGEHRNMIDQETRRAIEYYDVDNILFYVKNDKQTKEEWQAILHLATENGIKYIEYFDQRDFKNKFYARLMKVIKLLHDENDVPFLSGDL